MTDAAPTDRFCLCNGAAIRYRDEGSGPAVTLVHGWTLDLEMWDSQAVFLRNNFRVIRYDRRGFGLSSGYPSIDRDGEDLEVLCKHLAVERVALVGMSQGARAVMRFAAAAPSKVSCVVLDGPPDLFDADAADFDALGQYSALARKEGMDAFRRKWIGDALVRLRTGDPSVHLKLRSMIKRYPGKDLLAAPGACAASPEPLPLEFFAIPALVITGEHDMAGRIETANVLASRLPKAERAVIPNAGHLPNLDNPVPYTAVVRAYLDRHATTPN